MPYGFGYNTARFNGFWENFERFYGFQDPPNTPSLKLVVIVSSKRHHSRRPFNVEERGYLIYGSIYTTIQGLQRASGGHLQKVASNRS